MRAQLGEQRLDVLRFHGNQHGVRRGGRLGDVDGAHAVRGRQVGRSLRMLLDDDNLVVRVMPAQESRQQRLADLAAADDGQPVTHDDHFLEISERRKNVRLDGRSASRRIR